MISANYLPLLFACLAVLVGMVVLYRATGDESVPDKIEPEDEEIAQGVKQCGSCGRLYPHEHERER